jgi:eukaryotic-like serine/threonine-protein kinase
MSRMTDQIGRVLSGRYRLIAPIGTGSSAQVFLADDVRLRRRVAVKILHAALADDDAFLRRFRAEAQAAAALNHPNIVAVYDWGDDDGAPYIVTEYLSGGSLRTLLDTGARLSQSQTLLIGLEATRGLDYAHRRGFVHRDIKPANLLFGDDARLRIADFGLARAIAEAAWTEPQGAVLGTARYASPEQAQGQAVDGRADVYSLGLVLIESVTGTVPFSSDTTIATLMARVGKPVEVPDALGPLQKPLTRAGLPEPADRPDAGELAIALMASAEDLPRPAPLPLAAISPVVDLTAGSVGADPTLLGTVLAPRPDSDGNLEAPTVEQSAEAAAAPSAPPEYLDDDLDASPAERRPRRWPWVIAASLVAVLVGGGAAWGYVQVRTPTYEVPSLVDMTEAQARAEVADYGFEIDIRDIRQDGSTPGTVLRTDPPEGESLEEGGTLALYVSLGNTPAPVPTDLVGMTLQEATDALADAGEFTPKVTKVKDEEVEAGRVMAVGPDVPAELPKGSEVPLTVSDGPEPRTVPSGLAGGTYEAAAAALEAVQLVPSKVDEFSDDVEAGQVIGLRPGDGTKAPRDSTVEVVVSKGPDLVEVPSVDGLTLEQAIGALEGAGFVVGDVSGPARGTPFTTNPEPGDKVPRGTTVDIYLRR